MPDSEFLSPRAGPGPDVAQSRVRVSDAAPQCRPDVLLVCPPRPATPESCGTGGWEHLVQALWEALRIPEGLSNDTERGQDSQAEQYISASDVCINCPQWYEDPPYHLRRRLRRAEQTRVPARARPGPRIPGPREPKASLELPRAEAGPAPGSAAATSGRRRKTRIALVFTGTGAVGPGMGRAGAGGRSGARRSPS